MTKKKKKTKPTELDIDEIMDALNAVEDTIELDFSGTLGQAAALLDRAASVAIQRDDVEAMVGVARNWMEMGALMHAASGGHKHPEGDDEDSGAAILGFGNRETREKAEAQARERKSQG